MTRTYKHVSILKRRLPELLVCLDISTPLLAKLFADDVITKDHWDRIKAHPTPIEKKVELVDILTTRSVQHFHFFCEALNQTGQGHVVQDILLQNEPNFETKIEIHGIEDAVSRTIQHVSLDEDTNTARKLTLYKKIQVMCDRIPSFVQKLETFVEQECEKMYSSSQSKDSATEQDTLPAELPDTHKFHQGRQTQQNHQNTYSSDNNTPPTCNLILFLDWFEEQLDWFEEQLDWFEEQLQWILEKLKRVLEQVKIIAAAIAGDFVSCNVVGLASRAAAC